MDRKLRRAVLEQLAAVEEMALQNLPVRVARSQLKIITEGWRELLLEHQPDAKGRCPVCSGWLRRRRWPCQVWVTAHQHLIGDGSAPMEGPGARSYRFRRPRQVEVIPRQVEVIPRQVEVIPRQVGASAATDQTPADRLRGAGEANDTSPPATTPRSPIHRAAVTERVPAMTRALPSQRFRT